MCKLVLKFHMNENCKILSVAYRLYQRSVVMEILTLNNCSQCFKKEWTSIMSPYYLCADCGIPKCPECKKTEVLYVVSLRNGKRATKILKCLSVDCLYSDDEPTDENNDDGGQYSRRWSLKKRKCVSRRLKFDTV